MINCLLSCCSPLDPQSYSVTGAEPPGALAVRAAILAANGYEEGARGDANNLGAEHLLPEERALIAPLLQ